MAANGSKAVGIIGAGIMGLSTAIRLQDADPSLDITIIAEKFSPDLTSNGAAGMWNPGNMADTSIEKRRQWGKSTIDYLKSIVKTERAASLHSQFVSGYFLSDEKIEDFPFEDLFVRAIKLSKKDLEENFPSRVVDGYFVTSVTYSATHFMHWFMEEFKRNGGKVIQKKVKSFDELAGKFDVVVNCSGLGSYELCQDKSLTPVRGQILKVKAPWLKHFYRGLFRKGPFSKESGRDCYIFPRMSDVVVGGTCQAGNWSTDVDLNDTREILKAVAEFEPTLKNAEIIETWVGLRPMRSTVRLEKEVMKIKTSSGSETLQVVHNYGHGGSGLSVFWGCAEETRDLVLSFLAISHL